MTSINAKDAASESYFKAEKPGKILFLNLTKNVSTYVWVPEFASVSSLHNKDFFLVFCKNLIRLMFSVLTIYTAAVIIVALLLKQKGKF